MKRKLTFAAMLVTAVTATAQTKTWTLAECLDYAKQNNITIQQYRNTLRTSTENSKAAQAAVLPSVSATVSQGYTQYASSGDNTYSGNYSLSAGMTLYNGGKLRNTI